MVGQPTMRRKMGNKIPSTSTRQEHRTVAGAMLLVLILSLVCAQWLSHYRANVSEQRFDPDMNSLEQFTALQSFDIDTLKLQLPNEWQRQGSMTDGVTAGVVQESRFELITDSHTTMHVFELDAGQTQDPQSVIYAGIQYAISSDDLSSFSIAHQWASRRANRMERRLLGISRSDGQSVLHHLMIWTHDGRGYWVFYTREAMPGKPTNSSRLAQFDKLYTSIALLAQDTRFKLVTAQDCADRQLGFSAELSDLYATCDPQSPSAVLLYPDDMDGFCIIRVARSAELDDQTLRQAMTWQFQATMHRQPTSQELTQDTTLGKTQWHTLHYPVDKDIGIGPEPLARDVHVIHQGQGVTLTVQVTGMVDAVKLAATRLPQLVKALGDVNGDTTTENHARQLGQSLVDHTSDHLKKVIKSERNFYTIGIANQPVGYQLESITRDQPQQALGSVHIVFPSTRGDASIDHQWKIDFAKHSFESATEDHSADGSVKKRSLSINNGRVICTSDQMAYDMADAHQIPWPISEDYWPVHWMTQQQLLGKWMLIRTAYSASPPTWHWVSLHKTDTGYHVMRRPILSVDTNVYMLDQQGQFVSLEGYDFEAAAHSTLALSVQRVPVDVVYNHWPRQKNDIAKWIKDHETTDH